MTRVTQFNIYNLFAVSRMSGFVHYYEMKWAQLICIVVNRVIYMYVYYIITVS